MRQQTTVVLGKNIFYNTFLKGIVHPIMTILSSFTHPHVITNTYDFLSSVRHKISHLKNGIQKKKKLVYKTISKGHDGAFKNLLSQAHYKINK